MRINDKENYDKIKNTINMTNLKHIINNKGFLITNVAINSKVSDSTISAYITGQKIPSVPTLVSMADYLNTTCDYLLGRTNNPISLDKLNGINDNEEINLLFKNILELDVNKQKQVMAYVKGLSDK